MALDRLPNVYQQMIAPAEVGKHGSAKVKIMTVRLDCWYLKNRDAPELERCKHCDTLLERQ